MFLFHQYDRFKLLLSVTEAVVATLAAVVLGATLDIPLYVIPFVSGAVYTLVAVTVVPFGAT